MYAVCLTVVLLLALTLTIKNIFDWSATKKEDFSILAVGVSVFYDTHIFLLYDSYSLILLWEVGCTRPMNGVGADDSANGLIYRIKLCIAKLELEKIDRH